MAGDEGDAAALLSVEDQVALQETLASLMEEIKALKKRAAVTAQSAGVAAAASLTRRPTSPTWSRC